MLGACQLRRKELQASFVSEAVAQVASRREEESSHPGDAWSEGRTGGPLHLAGRRRGGVPIAPDDLVYVLGDPLKSGIVQRDGVVQVIYFL